LHVVLHPGWACTDKGGGHRSPGQTRCSGARRRGTASDLRAPAAGAHHLNGRAALNGPHLGTVGRAQGRGTATAGGREEMPGETRRDQRCGPAPSHPSVTWPTVDITRSPFIGGISTTAGRTVGDCHCLPRRRRLTDVPPRVSSLRTTTDFSILAASRHSRRLLIQLMRSGPRIGARVASAASQKVLMCCMCAACSHQPRTGSCTPSSSGSTSAWVCAADRGRPFSAARFPRRGGWPNSHFGHCGAGSSPERWGGQLDCSWCVSVSGGSCGTLRE